jgi:N-acetylmuramoyl-L-alanine amidase
MKLRHDLLRISVAVLMLMVGSVAAMLVAQPAHAAPAAVAARLDKPAIIDTRIEAHGEGTRVGFDITTPVRFDIMVLTDPYRIVIELEELRWQPTSREIPIADGIVSRVRYGVFRPGISRIVLDCARPAVVEDAYVSEPAAGRYRLVIDLAEVSHAVFLQSVKAQRPVKSQRLGSLAPPGLEGAHVASQAYAVSDAGLPPEAALFVREAAATTPPATLARLAVLPSFAPPPRLAALPFAPPPRKPRSMLNKRVIVIDPGHGGSDPGAISASGVYEKTVTLKAARLVQKELLRFGHYIVVLTRNGDQTIALRDRVAFARAADADLFISLHADAHPDPAVRGASVYTLSKKASDAEAAALAERENKADLISGVDLSHEAPEVANILIDLAQRETMNRSASVAKLLVRHLGKRTALVRNTHRFAGFAVLKAPDVPAVLVELGYTSNLQDRRMLQQESYLKDLAAAIAEAVASYLTLEEARRS